MKTRIYDLDTPDTLEGSKDNPATLHEAIKDLVSFDPMKDVLSKISNSFQYEPPDVVMPDMEFGTMNRYPELSEIYPKGNKKYRVPRKILLLLNQKTATKFQIARCIAPKLTKKNFNQKSKLANQVENSIQSLNRTLKQLGCFITTKLGNYELTRK